MTVVRFHCPFVGLNSCQDGGGNGLTKTSLITHLRDRHCSGDAQAIMKQYLSTNLAVFEEAEVTFKHMGIWLCGVCFKTHTLRSKCRHNNGSDFVSPPDCGDGVVRFLLYDITKPHVPSFSEQLKHVDDLGQDQHGGFTLVLLDNLLSKGLHTVKSIPLKCHLGFSWVLKGAIDKVICMPHDISCSVSLPVLPLCGSFQLMRETLAESSPPLSHVDEEDLDLDERNIKQYKRKIYDGHYTTPDIPIDSHHLIASPTIVLDRLKSFPRGTSCGWDRLRAQHLMDCLSRADIAISDKLVSFITQVVNLFLDGKCPKLLGEYIASAPLTPLVKPGNGILHIVIGTIWSHLVSKVGVGVSGGSEVILHAVNRLIEDRGGEVGLSMLLVDFKNAFNLVDREIRDSFSISLLAWYLDDGPIVGDTLVMGKVLELVMKDGPRCGIHLNVGKTEVFWLKEDPKSRLAGIFPPNISWPLHGVKLVGGPVSMDIDFSSELVMKRVAKTIKIMNAVAMINDPQCELLILRACTSISKLYFAMRTCPPRVFKSAQHSFDAALRSSLERIVIASGPVLGDWQWRLATLPFAFGGLLLRHTGIVVSGPIFDDVFNTSMKTDLLSNPSEIAAPKLMKKLADIYLTLVTKTIEFTFSLTPRQMALWKSQLEDHASDWLRVVLISGLGHTMNGKTYRCVLCYRLGVPLFSVLKPCSTCSKVFAGDIYGDHAVSCADIIGIKHRHNVVRDTLVDICYYSEISADKEVDIGLDGGRDKPLRPADIAVIDAAHHKRVKYETKCAAIGYGFLPFSFSSFGELEEGAITLLKRIRKFSMTQDIEARAAVHIFNRIGFTIAKGVGA
ncbi:hypothetical protein Tco_0185316 [Tanacetum coccineum]